MNNKNNKFSKILMVLPKHKKMVRPLRIINKFNNIKMENDSIKTINHSPLNNIYYNKIIVYFLICTSIFKIDNFLIH